LCDYAASNRNGGASSGDGLVQCTYDHPERLVRIGDVTNGMSNTLMVGEKRMNLGMFGQDMQDDNQGYSVGFDEDTMRCTNLAPGQDYVKLGGYTDTGHLEFGSSHVGGFNAVFADGSVHNISYGIPVAIFKRIGNFQNRQAIGGGEWW
jgi:prepilin-type processing-associated H-X9-DG protein